MYIPWRCSLWPPMVIEQITKFLELLTRTIGTGEEASKEDSNSSDISASKRTRTEPDDSGMANGVDRWPEINEGDLLVRQNRWEEFVPIKSRWLFGDLCSLVRVLCFCCEWARAAGMANSDWRWWTVDWWRWRENLEEKWPLYLLLSFVRVLLSLLQLLRSPPPSRTRLSFRDERDKEEKKMKQRRKESGLVYEVLWASIHFNQTWAVWIGPRMCWAYWTV